MSHSRKKTKKLQKQRQQKRQDTLKRKEKALQRQSEQVRDEVLEDMLPLFSPFVNFSAASGQGMEELMKTLVTSGV